MKAKDVVTEYVDCEAAFAVFTTDKSIENLFPEGMNCLSDPPIASVWVTWYPITTIGPYHEMFSLIQVEFEGEVGFYIPYIYIGDGNDAALCGGREVVGAPKKLAHITLNWERDLVIGTLERPVGKRLLTLTVKPEGRPDPALLSIMQERSTLFSLRVLPPIEGGDGVAQLVKWYSYMFIPADDEKRTTFDHVKIASRRIFGGEASITYDSPSASDPVHKIPVKEVLFGAYMKYDLVLRADKVVKEWRL